MLENRYSPVLPRKMFLQRLLKSSFLAVIVIAGSVFLGMCGYHYLEDISWINAYLDSTMTVSGVGAVSTLETTPGKIFAGTFALYSSFVVVVAISLILAPILHRFLHKFHVEKS